ncbi:dihydropteroate synthase [Streptomyces sp. OV198]|uniref:dihydropteroate synthase n=1 Tax=Streptomyces sp. OV198 TaxID=1882787 RepID=UPI0027B8A4E1|nr:dihydropteroate synthase [Streptomyces sp. OV198]
MGWLDGLDNGAGSPACSRREEGAPGWRLFRQGGRPGGRTRPLARAVGRHGRPGRLRRCRVRGRQGSRTPDGHRGVRLGRPSQAIVDPGLGFAKTCENDWTLLARVDAWAQLGRPVLVAASRKRFLGRLRADRDTGEPPSGPRPRCCHRGGIGAGRRPGRDMAMSVGGSVSAAASRRRLRVV